MPAHGHLRLKLCIPSRRQPITLEDEELIDPDRIRGRALSLRRRPRLLALLSVVALFLPAARAQDDPLTAALDAAWAQGLDYRTRLDSLSARLERRREAERSLHAQGLEEILRLTTRADTAPPGGGQADSLFDQTVARLQRTRLGLRQALDAMDAASAVPDWPVNLDPAASSALALQNRVRALDSLRASTEAEAEGLRRLEASVRWEALQARGDLVRRLNALRIAELSRLSPARRREILGITQQGFAQLRREITQIDLAARLYLRARIHDLHSLPAVRRNVFRVGSVLRVTLELIALVIAFAWVWRRWKPAVVRLRRGLFRRVRGYQAKQTLEAGLGMLEVLGPWGLYLLTLSLAEGVLGEYAHRGELSLLLRLARIYGYYRLAIDACYALLLRAAGRYRFQTGGTWRRRAYTSIRAAARLLGAVSVLLLVSALFLGRGYLYHLVLRLAWVFGVLFALRLLGAWRGEISSAYLQASPQGRVAAAVRRYGAHWYGLFVSLLAFLFLAARAAAALARDFAMGFDQTRKALAFVSRKRMEKQAEKRGYAEARPEDLPSPLRQAFSEDPLERDAPAVDCFPGLDRLQGSIEQWRAGNGGGIFLLTGEPGTGKTSWLARIPSGDLAVTGVHFTDRPASAAELARTLGASLLEKGAAPESMNALATALLALPPRIVCLESLHSLFLSAIGGYDCLEAFLALAEATSRKVYWVCTCDGFAWIHLKAVRPEMAVFRGRQKLGPWSEKNIRALLQMRLSASGMQARYDDLVLDRMEGVSAEATLLRTEEGYSRLIWDYADGNPRVAINCWLRSVDPEGPDRVRVRLFRSLGTTELESAGESGLFVLAAIVNHVYLTLEETSRVTHYPPGLCRIQLDRFSELGALLREDGRYRVATPWQRPVIRLLRRRNLLQD